MAGMAVSECRAVNDSTTDWAMRSVVHVAQSVVDDGRRRIDDGLGGFVVIY
jgi:hypothetical protein